MPPFSPEAFEVRLRNLEEDRRQFAEAIKLLTRLEAHHGETREALARGSETMKDHEDRIREIQEALPMLKETSAWVRFGVLGIFGMFGTLVWQVVTG